MDHAVGVGAADALGAHLQLQVLVHGVELVLAALGAMRRIGDEPELVRPGHDRPDAAFAVRLNTARCGYTPLMLTTRSRGAGGHGWLSGAPSGG